MTAAISIIELKPPAVRAVTAFDYGALAPDVAAEIRRQANQIKSKITKTTQDLIVIGRDLEAVKERPDHGQFTTWVESELGIVVRTAQLYMAVARLAKDKGESISLLPSPTVHRLAAKSTPPEVVAEVVARANSGEIVPDAVVKGMVSEAKCQRREAERQEREKVRSSEESNRTREKRERWKEHEEEARQ